MNNATAAVLALVAGIAPLLADITPEGLENWLKIGGLAGVTFILSYQLVQTHKHANTLRKQLLEAVTRCHDCPLVQAANKQLLQKLTDINPARRLPPQQ